MGLRPGRSTISEAGGPSIGRWYRRRERFIQLADAFGEGIAVDVNPAMVDAARRNLPASLSDCIRFGLTPDSELRFAPNSFDVVLNRHAGVNPDAIVRILRPGGWFVFQGIGNRKNEQIWNAFGWDPIFPSRADIEAMIEAFERRGCRVAAVDDECNRAWFSNVESLVFYLKAVHLPEAFDPSRHVEQFNRYLAANAGPNGYAATEHGTPVDRPQARLMP